MTPEGRDTTTGDLVALDPGVRSPGIALFRAGILVAAKRLKGCTRTKDQPGARWLRVAHIAAAWCTTVKAYPRTLVYEKPQIYGVGKSEVDPNDLIGLVGIGSAFAGILAMGMAAQDVALEVVTPEPDEWTMGTKKNTEGDPFDCTRARAIFSRLSPEEAELVPASHDALDAVGLGLFATGRFRPRRVFPGAVP